MKKQKGFNFVFTAGGKLFAGTQQNSFGITPRTKDSITKDDEGQSQTESDGYDSEISVTGIMTLAEAGDTATHTDYSALRQIVKDGTKVQAVYGSKLAGAATEAGEFICTSYKESTDSENYGTYDATFKLCGALTAGVVAGGN